MPWYVRAVLSILALISISWPLSLFKFTPRYLKFATYLRLLPSFVILVWGTCFPNVITFDFSTLIISFFLARVLLHISMFFCRFCSLLTEIARSSAKTHCCLYTDCKWRDPTYNLLVSFLISAITSSIIKLNSNGFSTPASLKLFSTTNSRDSLLSVPV